MCYGSKCLSTSKGNPCFIIGLTFMVMLLIGQWQRQNNDEAALNLIQSFEASEEDTSSPTMVSITSTRVHYGNGNIIVQ